MSRFIKTFFAQTFSFHFSLILSYMRVVTAYLKVKASTWGIFLLFHVYTIRIQFFLPFTWLFFGYFPIQTRKRVGEVCMKWLRHRLRNYETSLWLCVFFLIRNPNSNPNVKYICANRSNLLQPRM